VKEKELRDVAECHVCNNKFGHTGVPIFYRAEIKAYQLNTESISRQSGFEQMMGSVALAQVMGANEDMAKECGSINVTICFNCMAQEGLIGLSPQIDVMKEK